MGFLRYWLSELHRVPTNAGATPEIAVAAMASTKRNLRVGSGGVLLNHRSPYGILAGLEAQAAAPAHIALIGFRSAMQVAYAAVRLASVRAVRASRMPSLCIRS